MTAIRAKRRMKGMLRMGLTYVDCQVENIRQPAKKATVRKLLADTGSLHTWIPSETLKRLGIEVVKKDMPFTLANGEIVRRSLGYAILRAAGFETVDEVVFGQPGDMSLLGAKTLEGFGALVDPTREKLAGAGPAPAAFTRKRGKA